MRLLQRFRHHRAVREVKELALVLPAVVPEHGQGAADRVLPDEALVAKTQVKGVQFGDGGAFAESEFDPPVRNEVEGRDSLGHAGRMVGGELHDAVAQPDVARAAGWRLREITSGAEECEYSSRKWCSTSQA